MEDAQDTEKESNVSPWLPMAKNLKRLLPRTRPYSELEAMYSIQLDHNDGNTVTIEGYAKLWGWGRKKVKSFFETIEGVEIEYPLDTTEHRKQRGFLTPKKGTLKEHKKGHIIFIDYRHLQGKRNISGNIKGDTTIEKEKYEEKRGSKKGKKSQSDPRVIVFINWFSEKFQRAFSREYIIGSYPKAGAQVKVLLALPLSWENLQYIVIEFLLDQESFLLKAGHHFGTLLTKIGQNAYSKYLEDDFRDKNRKHIITETGESAYPEKREE